jgi:hypothetical protein
MFLLHRVMDDHVPTAPSDGWVQRSRAAGAPGAPGTADGHHVDPSHPVEGHTPEGHTPEGHTPEGHTPEGHAQAGHGEHVLGEPLDLDIWSRHHDEVLAQAELDLVASFAEV